MYFQLPRRQCAFSKESSKYVGCGILKRNFYTRFIPIFKDFGAVTWSVRKMVKYDLVNCTWLIFCIFGGLELGCYLSYDKWLCGVGSSKKSRISSEKPTFRAKCRWFQAKYQKFPQDVKVDLIICGKETVFCGIIS